MRERMRKKEAEKKREDKMRKVKKKEKKMEEARKRQTDRARNEPCREKTPLSPPPSRATNLLYFTYVH